jgi:hypothetical protein
MSNPSFLLCDTDFLIQFFVAQDLRPLRELKRAYGIQPSIVAEVEIELRSNKKYRKLIEPQFDKAMGSILQLFDEQSLSKFLAGSETFLPPAVASTTWSGIQARGRKYNLHVGIGEAYTHATAASLNLPSASNDSRALNLLEQKGLAVPSPVFRTYDLLVLTYQGELLTEADCESVRKALLAVGEPVPEECRNRGFVNGIQSLNARLLDRSKPAIGRDDPRRHQYDKILYVDRQ